MLTFEESTVSSIARLGTPSACKKAFNVCSAPDSYLYFEPREGKAKTLQHQLSQASRLIPT